MSSTPLVLAASAAGSWALTQVLMKSGLQHMDLVAFALLRLVVGALLVTALGLATSELVFPGWRLVLIAASGGLVDSFLGTASFLYAVRHAPSHIATALANAAPLWGILGASLILREPVTWTVGLASLLVVAGAWQLGRTRVQGTQRLRVRVVAAAVLAGICWGIAAAVPAKYCIAAGAQPSCVQLSMLLASAAGWGVVMLIRRSWRASRPTPRGLGIAVLTAFTGYLVGWALWLRALADAPAVVLSPIRGGGMTVFAFLLSIILFRERPRLRAFAGAALVLGGIVVVSWAG